MADEAIPFETVLVANRGEIACRVMRTVQAMGLRTVAVYSDADAEALHVEMADTAVRLGPAPASESYLRGEAILAAATRTGAEAIHPGYGFLSENAAFAEACAAAGVTFIGPPPAAIRAMGSKVESKRLMAVAGVPLVPGYHDEAQDDDSLAAAAEQIGYPVLLKASAGGGGKGMRIVTRPADLSNAILGARREALAAFADGTLLIEKYLDRPRHVEVQIFADRYGGVVHLFERDCSIQRRHQKVIEEAPAPSLSDSVRRDLQVAALAAARAIGYVGAGTVEFLYQDGGFFFIEMNTRLQVEHPVTELISGVDLVAWQILVAGGAPLPLSQEQIRRDGHAIEVRLYAEDPARDFLPAIGRLIHMRAPAEDRHVRIDSGVRQGDAISVHYDPMIAKLAVWDHSRPATLRRLRRALAAFEVAGVVTNLGFLGAIAGHPAFERGAVDTGFIDRHYETLIPGPEPVPADGLALAALAVLLHRTAAAQAAARATNDPHSPWHLATGWRLNEDNYQELRFIDAGEQRLVVVHYRRDGWDIALPDGGRLEAARASLAAGRLTAELDGIKHQATVVFVERALTLIADGRTWLLLLDDPALRAAEQDAGGRLTAPMPGLIGRVQITAGQAVKAGAPLLVLEAMKMEHTLTAPTDGVVVAVHYRPGDTVAEGTELIVFEAAAEEAQAQTTTTTTTTTKAGQEV